MNRSLLAIATFAMLASPAGRALAQDTGIAVGSAAPGAMVHTLDGKAVNLASFLGRTPVVMEFWATWCPLCRQLEPRMKAALSSRGDAITFVGVTVPQNQTPEKTKAFIEKNDMHGTFLFDTDGMAYKAYSAPHTSYVVVIDRGGKVVYTGVGGDQDIDGALAKLHK